MPRIKNVKQEKPTTLISQQLKQLRTAKVLAQFMGQDTKALDEQIRNLNKTLRSMRAIQAVGELFSK